MPNGFRAGLKYGIGCCIEVVIDVCDVGFHIKCDQVFKYWRGGADHFLVWYIVSCKHMCGIFLGQKKKDLKVFSNLAYIKKELNRFLADPC